MAIAYDDVDRKVVPRWREFDRTLVLDELSYVERPTPMPPTAEVYFGQRLHEWETHRTFSFAADLVGCALVLGRERDVREAAECVLKQSGPEAGLVRDMARRVLYGYTGPEQRSAASTTGMEEGHLQRRIHELRIRISSEPRNAFLWTDLALAYETRAQPVKARRAIETALALARENRFVIRAACRLNIHQNEYTRAFDVLDSSECVKRDPWVLASHIAVGCILRRPSRLAKFARSLVERDRFPPFHNSELASALATLELAAGDRRRCRKLLEASLREPSENALAQASWLVTRGVSLHGIPDLVSAGRSNEARAWQLRQSGNWEEALSECDLWMADQRFSSRPAIFGSFIAAVCLRDFARSAAIAREALLPNPTSTTLLNNAAFSLAKQDKTPEARELLSRVAPGALDDEDKIVWLATSGLLRFREGAPADGERLYEEAIQLATRRGDVVRKALARANFAEELHRLPSPRAAELAKTAVRDLERMARPEFRPMIDYLNRVC